MPSLPQPLRSGDPITRLVPWSERIIAYLRAITVRPSATVKVATTANGTTLTAAGGGKGKGQARASGGYVYTGEFAISLLESGGGVQVKNGEVCVNGVRLTVEKQNIVISVTTSLYLVVNNKFQVSIQKDTTQAIGYIKLGTVTKEDDVYTIEQAYLGGTGANIVVAEECHN